MGKKEQRKRLIFLHGLGQTASSWKGTIERLDPSLEAVCLELSRFWDGKNGKNVNYANLYEAFCQYCGQNPEPVSLCGLSLGGILALQYGIEHPEKVDAMVLIGVPFAMPKALLTMQNILFRWMPARCFKDTGLEKDSLIALCKSMMDLDFREALPTIKCPVLVVCGEKDRANQASATQFCEQLPQASLSMIKGAGHEVNRDAPDQLAVCLNSFFATDFGSGS